MTDPLQPHDIARRTFDVARRGYEQQEVRGFLHEVAAVIERLGREEQELRDRAERAEAKLGTDQRPDEAMLLEVLGEETTRVLTSARDAAAEIRTKAEAAAARIIAEATAEAAEVRSNAVRDADSLLAETNREREMTLEAARTELDRRSAEAEEVAARITADGEAAAQRLREEGHAELAAARAEAEEVVAAARQEGRVMVAEAQAVRERVLRDLAVRRKRARQQVEKLNAGRERLLEAYDVVRRTVEEATDELTTSLSDARLAADAAARRIDEEPEPTLEQLDEEVANAGLIDLPIADLGDDHGIEGHDRSGHDDDGPGPFSGEVPAVATPEETVPADASEGAPVGDAPAAPTPVEEPAPPRLTELEERRGRKRRKRGGGFEGLPPSELTVLQPPDEDEGVRILADPAVPEAAVADSEPLPEPVTEPEPGTSDIVADDDAADAAEPTDDAAVDDEGADAEESPADATGEVPAAEEGVAAAPTGEAAAAPTSSADSVFARLRAEQGSDPDPDPDGPAAEDVDLEAPGDSGDAEPVAASDDETTEDTEDIEETEAPVAVDDAARPFAARRAALGAVEKDLARRLKRGLADEQNEVLDLLRRAKPKGVDDLLPSVDDHAARWADLVTPSLGDAAAAGADWTGGTPSSVADLADELARGLTVPLRERIERSFAASDGNLDDVADRVRALYREWKGQRLADTSADFVAAAYARGVFDGLPVGANVHWVVDPEAGACPDCDDNVLAGALLKGTEFPTGNLCAPAHPGCHCLVLATDD